MILSVHGGGGAFSPQSSRGGVRSSWGGQVQPGGGQVQMGGSGPDGGVRSSRQGGGSAKIAQQNE